MFDVLNATFLSIVVSLIFSISVFYAFAQHSRLNNNQQQGVRAEERHIARALFYWRQFKTKLNKFVRLVTIRTGRAAIYYARMSGRGMFSWLRIFV